MLKEVRFSLTDDIFVLIELIYRYVLYFSCLSVCFWSWQNCSLPTPKKGSRSIFQNLGRSPPTPTEMGGGEVPQKNVGLKANLIGPNFKYLAQIANLLLLLIQIYFSIISEQKISLQLHSISIKILKIHEFFFTNIITNFFRCIKQRENVLN